MKAKALIINFLPLALCAATYPSFVIEQEERHVTQKDGRVISKDIFVTRYEQDSKGNARLTRFPTIEAARAPQGSPLIQQETFYEAATLKAWLVNHSSRFALDDGKFAADLDRVRAYREPRQHEGVRYMEGQMCYLVPVWGDMEHKLRLGTACMSPLLRLPLEIERRRSLPDGSVLTGTVKTISIRILAPSEAPILTIPAGYELRETRVCTSCTRD